ncbi:MAG TPA: tryptophan 7-halogenase [Thermoanaerobaculia bacterium]|nr:tryptophan 7-halogenase [Thermoanaerobaculia bacterium]
MTSEHFDVAVIGGGPAGAAAALTLLRYTSRRVVVIERSGYDEWRAGETLSPGATPLLQYLGVSVGPHLRASGTAAAWGASRVVSRDFFFTGAGDGMNLDRRAFDRALIASVPDVRLRTHVVGVSDALSLSDGSAITADFVIDASGRHASFARLMGAKPQLHDQLTGVIGVYATRGEIEPSTLVEAVPYGWWYSAPIPGEQLVVALMTDADIVRERGTHLSFDDAPATRARVGEARLLREPVILPAHSARLDRIAGEGWAAAGEAAASFDPLSSMGIGYALTSGINAARAADSWLRGNKDHLQVYAADVARHFDAYLDRRGAYYAMEQRWPDEPFWSRRITTSRTHSSPR